MSNDNTLFAMLPTGNAPKGFSYRVMDRIVSERLRRAERQGKRDSLLSSVLLLGLALLGVFASIQFEWTGGAWLDQMPMVPMVLCGGGFLALTALDSIFEERNF